MPVRTLPSVGKTGGTRQRRDIPAHAQGIEYVIETLNLPDVPESAKTDGNVFFEHLKAAGWRVINPLDDARSGWRSLLLRKALFPTTDCIVLTLSGWYVWESTEEELNTISSLGAANRSVVLAIFTTEDDDYNVKFVWDSADLDYANRNNNTMPAGKPTPSNVIERELGGKLPLTFSYNDKLARSLNEGLANGDDDDDDATTEGE